MIRRLKEARIYFEIRSHRDDYIMLDVRVPGERWEIELSSDGSIEVEVLRSDGDIFDESKLDDLFQRHSDEEPN